MNDQNPGVAQPKGLPDDPHDPLLRSLHNLIGKAPARRAYRALGADGLRTLPAAEIVSTAGVPDAAAARIVAAREFGLTLMLARPGCLRSSADIAKCIPPTLPSAECEMLLAVALSPQLLVKRTFVIATGGHASTPGVAIVDVLAPLIRVRASSFVLVHNHPSGDPSPSREDVELTNRVARAAHVLAMRLVDHLVVATGGVVSFFDTGLLLSDEELDAGIGTDAPRARKGG